VNVAALKEVLSMWSDDTQIYIATTPDDLAQPLDLKLIRTIPASSSERYGLEREKLLFTAFIPRKDKP
jgi:hypothetical protein